ncbi:MAG: hypothetical protein IT535_02185 [Bauldia sp.]|nr:hypothetical protein [Bauldia sp.]
MADLKIRVLKGGEETPATTVTIPGNVLKIASNLIPHRAMAALREQGFDLDELVRLSQNPEATGTLLEIDNHEKGERIILALE